MHQSRAFQNSPSEDAATLSPKAIVIITLSAGIYALQKLLTFLDYPKLSLPELLWNALVYIMPLPLVSALGPGAAQSQIAESSNQHATKSQIMRSVLRLDHKSSLHGNATLEAPAGLGNWDNSCYQNSVLQALASLRSLGEFLTLTIPPKDDALQINTAVALRDLIRDLNSPYYKGKHLWTPPKLKSMSSWQQQDAQEYLSKVLEQVDKDTMQEIRTRRRSQAADDFKSLCRSELRTESHALDHTSNVSDQNSLRQTDAQRNRSENASNVSVNPLEGLLAQRVGCTRCGFSEGISLIPFNCLTLPLGRDSSYTLEECLDEYTKLESIEGVECAKCTLSHHQRQLQQLLEASSAQENNHNQEGDEVGGVHESKADFVSSVKARLRAISQALEDEDYSETTLLQKCQIPSRLRTTTIKSRQGVIMRPPQSLIMHVNRSVFDELTGAQLKNYASVKYSETLNLAPWCVGETSERAASAAEQWEMNPSRSMIPNLDSAESRSAAQYLLRAIVTHHGRHENGHYVCLKKVSADDNMEQGVKRNPSGEEGSWWRLSDETVYEVDSDYAMDQDGAFMLFYERISAHISGRTDPYPPTETILMTKSPVVDAITSDLDSNSSESKEEDTANYVDAEESLPTDAEFASAVRHGRDDTSPGSTRGEIEDFASESLVSSTARGLEQTAQKLIAPTAMKTAGPDHRVEEDSAFPHMQMIATV